jgi:hypothetical protein
LKANVREELSGVEKNPTVELVRARAHTTSDAEVTHAKIGARARFNTAKDKSHSQKQSAELISHHSILFTRRYGEAKTRVPFQSAQPDRIDGLSEIHTKNRRLREGDRSGKRLKQNYLRGYFSCVKSKKNTL